MAKPFTWSYSALTAWETCPKRVYHTRIKKDWPDEKGEAATWGDTVHKAFESRLKYQTPLPAWGTQWESLCAKLSRAGDALQVEQKIALTADFRPTEFFARDVWVRAVADVAVFKGNLGFTLDWKTGKHKWDTDQLRLSAAIQLSHRPHLENQTIQYIWLKDNKTTTETIPRAEVPVIWQQFLPRVHRMQEGYESGNWVAKPSGLCRAYCPVLSCEYNGRRK